MTHLFARTTIAGTQGELVFSVLTVATFGALGTGRVHGTRLLFNPKTERFTEVYVEQANQFDDVLLVLAIVANGSAYAKTTAIVGGTIIDLNRFGRSENDIENAAVLIRDGKIIAVGSESNILIPQDAERIDGHGKYLVPGLIDGFAALRAQKFAQAFAAVAGRRKRSTHACTSWEQNSWLDRPRPAAASCPAAACS